MSENATMSLQDAGAKCTGARKSTENAPQCPVNVSGEHGKALADKRTALKLHVSSFKVHRKGKMDVKIGKRRGCKVHKSPKMPRNAL